MNDYLEIVDKDKEFEVNLIIFLKETVDVTSDSSLR